MKRTTPILLLSFFTLVALTGCGLVSSVSDSMECVRIENLINPDTTSYTVVSETGVGLRTKKAGYKESNSHTFKVSSDGYSRSDLLVRVQDASGRILNERKDRLRFRSRSNQIGCRIIAISKPGDISFEFE